LTSVSFSAFAAFWLKIGCLSFGGPAGQIAMMQSELVDRLRRVDQRRFLHALNFCMLLPGPEAQQLATYLGWRQFGIIGGLVSGGLFILPGAAVLTGLSWLMAAHGEAPAVAAVFSGVKPAVVAIIFAAAWRVGRRTLTTGPAAATALSAFAALFFLEAPFPLVVLSAGALGAVAARHGRHWFAAAGHGEADETVLTEDAPPRLNRLLWLVLAFAALWAAPLLLTVGLLGAAPWRDLGLFFTKAAFVTFGGAYAVLPYVAQQAVETFGWLSPAQMLDGLALAETTPGPLILVLQYVGFLAGWDNPGPLLSPLQGGLLGAGVTLWVTFLPSFFFIFAGAPYVERLIHNPMAAGALAAITAAVVGVIGKLGVYLALEVLTPGGSPDLFAVASAGAALIALIRFGVALHWVVATGAALGAAVHLL
jgi:chromate transporter